MVEVVCIGGLPCVEVLGGSMDEGDKVHRRKCFWGRNSYP